MSREVRLMVTCNCGDWDVQIAESEVAAEKRLEVRGWLMKRDAEKCPACKSGRKKQLKGDTK